MKKTKADLEMEIHELKHELAELEDFKLKVIESVNKIAENTCEDGREYIEEFCNDVGIDYPEKTIILRVKIPFHVDLDSIDVSDYDGNLYEYEVLLTNER